MDVRAGRVTAYEADIDWDPPMYGDAPVTSYLVQYKERYALSQLQVGSLIVANGHVVWMSFIYIYIYIYRPVYCIYNIYDYIYDLKLNDTIKSLKKYCNIAFLHLVKGFAYSMNPR